MTFYDSQKSSLTSEIHGKINYLKFKGQNDNVFHWLFKVFSLLGPFYKDVSSIMIHDGHIPFFNLFVWSHLTVALPTANVYV